MQVNARDRPAIFTWKAASCCEGTCSPQGLQPSRVLFVEHPCDACADSTLRQVQGRKAVESPGGGWYKGVTTCEQRLSQGVGSRELGFTVRYLVPSEW